MKFILSIFVLFSFITSSVHAQIYGQDTLDVNQYLGTLDAEGNLFAEFMGGATQVPKDYINSLSSSAAAAIGNKLHTFFGVGFNYVGFDSRGDSLLSCREFDYMSNFSPGPYTLDSAGVPAFWNRTYKVDKQQLLNHWMNAGSAGYQMPDGIRYWPAHGQVQYGHAYEIAPFIDLNNNGQYEPGLGESPCVEGDQSILALYNDGFPNTMMSPGGAVLGENVGLEIQSHLFAYEEGSHGGILDSVVFLRHTIKNMRPDSLHDLIVMKWVYGVLGSANSERVRYDVPRNMLLTYNCDNLDSNGCVSDSSYLLQRAPRISAVKMLEGPKAPLGNNVDDNLNGVIDETDEDIRIGSYIRYGQVGINGEPYDLSTWHNYSQARWRFGSTLRHGGSGSYLSGSNLPRTYYYMPGVSNPEHPSEWTEESVSFLAGPRRGFMNIGPIDMAPGESKVFYFAYFITWPESGNELTGMPAIGDRADELQEWWDQNHVTPSCFTLSLVSNEVNQVVIYPNPVKNVLNVRFTEASETNWELTNLQGQRVRNGASNVQDLEIGVGGLPAGLYILRIGQSGQSSTHRIVIQ